MKAAFLYGREDVRVEEISERLLARGEIRLRVEAALTCGTDLKVFKRGYHAKMIVPPAVFGHELAGVITEVSPSVTNWQLGDCVVVANSVGLAWDEHSSRVRELRGDASSRGGRACSA